MERGVSPEVNAGSMADIAFLLLIFFLVTTTIETDTGLNRALPRMEEDKVVIDTKEKNILLIAINKKGELLVDGTVMDIQALRNTTIDFLDNGGAIEGDKDYCDYCQGKRDATSSDAPHKAIVSVTSDREAKYSNYIAVQNELMGAYTTLRNRASQRLFHMNYTVMEERYSATSTPEDTKSQLRANLKMIRDMYPMYVSEAATQIK